MKGGCILFAYFKGGEENAVMNCSPMLSYIRANKETQIKKTMNKHGNVYVAKFSALSYPA